MAISIHDEFDVGNESLYSVQFNQNINKAYNQYQ